MDTDPVPPKTSTPSSLHRSQGALLGLACGDALGAPIEFMDRITVRRRYGKVTDMMAAGTWAAGEWSDDTGLTLCLAEGILEEPGEPVDAVGHKLVEWSETAKDFAATIRTAIQRFQDVQSWTEASRSSPHALSGRAGGNGSLMRTLPVALGYAEADEILRVSASLSAMTHWDSQAEACCAIYNLWVGGLLRGEEMATAWSHALATVEELASQDSPFPETPGLGDLPEDFWSLLRAIPGKRYEELQPSGFASHCVECLEAAAWCCLNAQDAEQAILDAINLAGESDTIGAVAGGLAGAYWGSHGLPQRWLSILYDRERIEELGRRLDHLRDNAEN